MSTFNSEREGSDECYVHQLLFAVSGLLHGGPGFLKGHGQALCFRTRLFAALSRNLVGKNS